MHQLLPHVWLQACKCEPTLPCVVFASGYLPSLQRQLVQGMSELGEHALAEEFRKQLALPPDTLAPPDPGACNVSTLTV